MLASTQRKIAVKPWPQDTPPGDCTFEVVNDPSPAQVGNGTSRCVTLQLKSTGGSPAIQANDLTKLYKYHEQPPGILGAIKGLVRRQTRERLAVDRLDLCVPAGEIIGLLGPNGAGKTTTIKMMCGLLQPSSGALHVLGHEPARRSLDFLRSISVIFGQKSMLWWDVSTYESLRIHRRMYEISLSDFEEAVGTLTSLLQVEDIINVPVRKLSLGERMRCELMLALLHRPPLLFADEPTVGLDVVAKLRVREFLAQINRELGTTVVLTSHDMDDVAALCDRVAIINHGRIQFDGALEDLRTRTKPTKEVCLTYRAPIPAPASSLFMSAMVAEDPRVLRLDVARIDLPRLLFEANDWGELVDVQIADADLDAVMAQVFATDGLA